MGLSLGIALNMHYQVINLLIFFPAIFLIIGLSFKNKIYSFFLMLIGFLIPLLPLLYWDAHQNFANINNILDYLLIGQYRIYVPNSWSLFILKDIPQYWSFVVGKFYITVLAVEVLSVLSFIYLALRKKLKFDFVVLGLIFFILLFVNRFYLGERSEAYLLYLAPFILIFTAFFVSLFFEAKMKYLKLVGIIILTVILLGSFVTIIQSYSTSPMSDYEKIAQLLVNKYPNQKFHIYDYKNMYYGESTRLSIILSFKNKEDLNGIPLGVSCQGNRCAPGGGKMVLNSGIFLVDLRNINKNQLANNKIWNGRNQADVYDEHIGWSKSYSLTSPFSLKSYIIRILSKL